VFVVLAAVALISFLSNIFIGSQFETYITEQQEARTKNIAESLSMCYDEAAGTWDISSIHALGMYSLYDGYFIKVYDNGNKSVWDAERHDMSLCLHVMTEIAGRMSEHGADGDFVSLGYDVTRDGQKIGYVSVRYFGPFFMSESDFSFLRSLNLILAAIGALSLLFSVATGWLLARRIVNPIRKTVGIAKEISNGHYDVQFENRTKTWELHNLVSTFNLLAGSLAKQESLRKQLTADVAHELRTPLATLGSHLEAMIENVWEPTPARLKSCHDEILRLGNMVSDLERLERAESDNLKLDKAPVDLLALAKNVCGNFEGQMANKNMRLEIEGAQSVVSADKDRISGVISNLMSNAVKYTPSGGVVSIFVRDSRDTGAFIIEDTGTGIPEDELPFIFERFYRADKSRNRNTGGAGIGLAIVKSVVAAHGGTVTAENREGGGCVFSVVLPKKHNETP
jgi:signal transduction histidine kinase